MPSIEVTLSTLYTDSFCSTHSNSKQGSPVKRRTELDDHEQRSSPDPVGLPSVGVGQNNNHQQQRYDDTIIEINDDLEEGEVEDDSSIILERSTRNRRERWARDGVVRRFRSLMQQNFASRAIVSSSLIAESRRPPFVVSFVEH